MNGLNTPIPGLILRDEAAQDVRETFIHLAPRSIPRARNFVESVGLTFENLVAMPHLGSPRDLPGARFRGLRAWPVKNFKAYLIYYRPLASNDGVEILRVLHHSRDFESHLTDETNAENL